jgi:hypothetical protein
MYVRTLKGLGRSLGQPIQPLRTTFTSDVIIYKDKDGDDKCRLTKCSVYVPKLARYLQTIDLLVFFHGHDTCKQHRFDPEQVIKNFRMDDQMETATHPAALAVPSIFWNVSDSRNIRSAWSAAYMNAFVEEVLYQIGKASSSGGRPNLGRLILAGHSGAYDILTPLADQFDCGISATKRGALAQLRVVVAMDTTYALQHAKSLEKWARNFPAGRFTLVLSGGGTPPYVWKLWDGIRKKATGFPVRPGNLDVQQMSKDGHCALPGKYLNYFI